MLLLGKLVAAAARPLLAGFEVWVPKVGWRSRPWLASRLRWDGDCGCWCDARAPLASVGSSMLCGVEAHYRSSVTLRTWENAPLLHRMTILARTSTAKTAENVEDIIRYTFFKGVLKRGLAGISPPPKKHLAVCRPMQVLLLGGGACGA